MILYEIVLKYIEWKNTLDYPNFLICSSTGGLGPFHSIIGSLYWYNGVTTMGLFNVEFYIRDKTLIWAE